MRSLTKGVCIKSLTMRTSGEMKLGHCDFQIRTEELGHYRVAACADAQLLRSSQAPCAEYPICLGRDACVLFERRVSKWPTSRSSPTASSATCTRSRWWAWTVRSTGAACRTSTRQAPSQWSSCQRKPERSLRSQRLALTRELRRPRARFLIPDQRAPRSQRGPCGPVTRLNLRVVRFAEIGRCEQSYTDADARSAHTHQYRALPSHRPPTHECPRALAGLVIGWPLSSVT